jgi:Protein of unknown function (DUF1625).
MSETYTQTETTSGGETLLFSVLAFIIGITGICYSIRYQFDSETKELKKEQALASGSHLVASLTPETAASMEGKLVYYTADAKADQAVKDPITGVNANALRLSRRVESYSWVESSDSDTKNIPILGGTRTTTTYTYKKEWTKHPVDSSKFHYHIDTHANPKPVLTTQDFNAGRVLAGNYVIPHTMLEKVPINDSLDPKAALNVATLTTKLKRPVHLADSVIYIGKDSSHPEVGDLKVTYYEAPNGPVSVVAQKSKNTFVPFPTRGADVFLIQPGIVPVKSVFKHAQEELQEDIFGKRCLGLLCTWIAAFLLLAPFRRVFEPIPFISDLADEMSVWLSVIAAFVVNGLMLAGIWLVFKPGFALLVVAAVVVISFVVSGAASLFKRTFRPATVQH